jgi:penicillin amidase
LDGLTADPTVADAVGMLRAWDHDETAGSAAAALYQLWFRRHLRPALQRHALTGVVEPSAVDGALARLLPEEVLAADVRGDLAVLDSLRADPSTLHGILTRSLAAAFDEARSLLGDDPRSWRWGRLHHAAPAHPLAGLLPRARTRLPRLERAGSGDTVLSTAYDGMFRQTAGATFRIVVDVGDWDRSAAMNAPGQSGRPEDPHWDDLYRDWAEDRGFPLHFSREAVEAHAQTRYHLTPVGEARD